MEFTEPTSEQCEKRVVLFDRDGQIAWATFRYPQMGGYCSKAIIIANKGDENSCFDIYIWHDSEFPFGDGQKPVEIHHCDAEQFVEFGKEVMNMIGTTNAS